MERVRSARNILIVEDNALFAEMLAIVLGRAFVTEPEKPGEFTTFAYATSIAEALQRISSDRPFDLVVVDLILPDGDGTILVREIKARDPQTPVAVLSASEHFSEAFAAGADEVMPKDIRIERTVAPLARLLGFPDRSDPQAD